MLGLGEIASQSSSECDICCTVLHVGRVAVVLLCYCCCAYVLVHCASMHVYGLLLSIAILAWGIAARI